MLTGRYRIVGLLGRGGMGEVYRADDLKLGQPVALKFLPEALARRPGALQRFLAEVRLARQVSHPNVCRVYDAGEMDGRHFLTMEYVDGEDLASLLRRIGRLPSDKAAEIARQICAGLQSAHDRGVLHRDLKPANVMIDGRGKARITDFGLAVLALDQDGGGSADAGRAARAGGAAGADGAKGPAGAILPGPRGPGTPAYMAPEQLAGGTASARSDIYALGLVLYEMFTGRRAFAATSLPDLVRLHQESTPASPSTLVEGLDPAAERAILRCLEKDPRRRPASALALAAALPGGDPLAAALAAGETPSPEMVATAAVEGSLRPALAWICLAGVLASAGFLLATSSRLSTLGLAPLEKPPDVLVERARAILTRFGHGRHPADSVYGLDENEPYLDHIEKHDRSPLRWGSLGTRPGAAPILFWYRESAAQLLASFPSFVVERRNPPQVAAGSATVVLDPLGRLVQLEVIPEADAAAPAPSGPDWSALFSEAGLEPSSFTTAPPDRLPPVYCDARASWRGDAPDGEGLRLDIDAGALRGRAVYFRVAGPWGEARGESFAPITTPGGPGRVNIVLQIVILTTGLLLARRHLRLGRGDRAGAFRVAIYFLTAHMIVWALWAHHVAALQEEWALFIQAASWTLYSAGTIWVLYVALEPIVRRYWPRSIISWSRVLAGRFRDPLVGRDVLIGCLAGALISAVVTLGSLAYAWLALPPPRPSSGNIIGTLGLAYAAALPLDVQLHAMLSMMASFVVFLLCRILLRKPWLAAAAFFLVTAVPIVVKGEHWMMEAAFVGPCVALLIFVLIRHGLLASIATLFVVQLLLQSTPLTARLGAWYAVPTIASLVALLAVTACAFRVSLAGRPMFRAGLLSD